MSRTASLQGLNPYEQGIGSILGSV
ncbi:hypothetical protein LCGC14_3047980, partial [marine sediment metagenome]